MSQKLGPLVLVSTKNKKEKKIEWLSKLRDAVLSLKLILVTLDSEDDAYVIFETLNTRGKDLALSDLLKNLFARHLKASGSVDHAKIKWDEVLKTLGGATVDLPADQFITHSWASRFDAVTVKQAFPKFKVSITKDTATSHLDDFLADARHYRSVLDPTYPWVKEERDIAKSFVALQMFKVVQPAPALLSLVRAYRNKKIKLGKLAEALKAIEKFHFQFTSVTSSRSSGGISGMYSSFGRKLFSATDSNNAAIEIKSLIQKLSERRPSLPEFQAGFAEIVQTNIQSKQKALVRYILSEVSLYEKSTHVGDHDDLTIEHLFPQSAMDNFWTPEIVGQIGNLLFIDRETNKEIDSLPFQAKKKYWLIADTSYRRNLYRQLNLLPN